MLASYSGLGKKKIIKKFGVSLALGYFCDYYSKTNLINKNCFTSLSMAQQFKVVKVCFLHYNTATDQNPDGLVSR